MSSHSDNRAVLVTGASGLIGHHVIDMLRAAGRTVIAADRGEATLPAPAISLEIGDVHSLYRAIKDYDVGSIVHCGGISGPMLARDNPARIMDLNVGGTLDIAEAARFLVRRNGRCRLVFCSSLSVYGDQQGDAIDESAHRLARTVYGASKVAAEAMLRAYATEHGVEAASLRITWVYGPRRTTSCAIRQMIEDALDGRVTQFDFGEHVRRQFVHVEDVAQSIRLALEAPRLASDSYNVSAGVNPSLGEVAQLVRALLPRADIRFAQGADPNDNTLGMLSIDRISRELGYAPVIDLRDGIARYADWLVAQRSVAAP